MKLQKTSPNRSCTKRRVWSLFGGRQVESSTTTSWILAKPAQQRTLVNRKGPVLFHDSARPHVSQTTLQKWNDLAYETLPYPAYSPDLSSTDYHFSSISTTSCKRFSTTEQQLKTLSKNSWVPALQNSMKPE
uniref:Histone-lysine N-methyltransferase SETMAR n=1 Tax=Heterorhabditis bacteriophora TaxID=37862 RepID=A0A1I7XT86_HETBA